MPGFDCYCVIVLTVIVLLCLILLFYLLDHHIGIIVIIGSSPDGDGRGFRHTSRQVLYLGKYAVRH